MITPMSDRENFLGNLKKDDYAMSKNIDYPQLESETSFQNEAVTNKQTSKQNLINHGLDRNFNVKIQCGNVAQDTKTIYFPFLYPKQVPQPQMIKEDQVIREDTNMLPKSGFQTLLSDGKLVSGKISNLEDKDSQTAINEVIEYLKKDMPSGHGDDISSANVLSSPSDLLQWAKNVPLFGEPNNQIPTSIAAESDKPKSQLIFNEQSNPPFVAIPLTIVPDKTKFVGPNGKTLLDNLATHKPTMDSISDSSFIDEMHSPFSASDSDDSTFDYFEMSDGSTLSKPINEELSPLPSEISPILSDDDLTGLSIKQLNCRLKGVSSETVAKCKKRRRLLKNRTYAQRCRDKRVKTGQDSFEENQVLRKQISLATKEKDEYVKKCRELEEFLLLEQEMQKQEQQQLQHQQQHTLGDTVQNMTISANCGSGYPDFQLINLME